MPNIDKLDLEREIDKAIKEGRSINFNEIPIEHCKYMKKVAEDRLSKQGLYLSSVPILLAAAGISITLTYIYTRNVAELFGYIIGLSLIIIAALIIKCDWMPRYITCSRIILDAEKEIILSESNTSEYSGIIDFFENLGIALGSYLRKKGR